MKKRPMTFLAILALVALPAAALAAPAPGATTGGWEFTLGGFVKLDTFWDSTQYSKNMNTPVSRNNDPNFHHGRLRFTAQGSRFNFTIKGPDLWGAKTSAFIEIDFDSVSDSRQSASAAYVPRLRHAMFRLNWPETELLMGQYWSLMNEFYPDLVQDGPFQLTGAPTHRLAQIRFTQLFGGMFRFAAVVGSPTDPNTASDALWESNQNRAPLFPYASNGVALAGASAETPQLQALIGFEKDLYGKAGFFGKPRGFVAQVAAGWQRTRYRNNVVSVTQRTFGEDQYNFANSAFQENNQIMSNWIVMGSLFVPVIPTRTANLAGTLSLQTQWYIGQGVSAFGLGVDADNSYYQWNRPGFSPAGVLNSGFYDVKLQNRYGGYIQGQYYFTNQWFMTVAYGMSKAFQVTQDRNPFVFVTTPTNAGANNGAAGIFDRSKYMSPNDQEKMMQQWAINLWYQPITALKFGLQYQFTRTDYFQKQRGYDPNINTFSGGRIVDQGDNHRVQFVGLYFF